MKSARFTSAYVNLPQNRNMRVFVCALKNVLKKTGYKKKSVLLFGGVLNLPALSYELRNLLAPLRPVSGCVIEVYYHNQHDNRARSAPSGFFLPLRSLRASLSLDLSESNVWNLNFAFYCLDCFKEVGHNEIAAITKRSQFPIPFCAFSICLCLVLTKLIEVLPRI